MAGAETHDPDLVIGWWLARFMLSTVGRPAGPATLRAPRVGGADLCPLPLLV
jgi:hypothetical protein